MKQVALRLFCVIAVMASLSGSLFAGITFRDDRSALVVSNGATLKVAGTNLLVANGTLQFDTGAQMMGGTILVDSGHFVESGYRTDLTASVSLTTTGIECVHLGGNQILVVDNDTVSRYLMVEGPGNWLKGRPTFDYDVTLSDKLSLLNVSVQNCLNRNIELRSSWVKLHDDLHFADDMAFTGSGNIDLNGYSCEFGGQYGLELTSTITWWHAADIVLTGSVILSGKWTFTTESVVNGNGNQLDLSTGGALEITGGTKLYLNNLRLTGLQDGSLILTNTWSELILSDVQLDMASAMTTTTGVVRVVSASTLVLGREGSWTFTNEAQLSVDGCSLWLDPLDEYSFPPVGQIFAPDVLYDMYPGYNDHQYTNLKLGNLSLLHSGTIKLTHDAFIAYNTYAAHTFSPYIIYLVSGSVAGTHVIDQTHHLYASEVVHITGDTSLDGQGNSIIFTECDHAQLVIDPAKTLTLRNIRLSNITANTISMGVNSVLALGENVVLEFGGDVVFKDGFIRLVDTPNSTIFRGLEGSRVVKFDTRLITTEFMCNIQGNSLVLEDLELRGVNHVDHSEQIVGGVTYTGSIVLNGDATIYADESTDTKMHFVVCGVGNQVLFGSSPAYFKGSMRFDDFAPENAVRFNLSGTLGVSDPEQTIPLSNDSVANGTRLEERTIVFSTGFLEATSEHGTARVIFDDDVQIINRFANSFVLGRGAELIGQFIYVRMNPILQKSPVVVTGRDLILKGDQTDAITLDPSIRALGFTTGGCRARDLWLTPFDLVSMKRAQQLASDAYTSHTLSNKDSSPSVASKPRVTRERGESTISRSGEELTRGEFEVPADTIVYRGSLQIGAAAGTVNLEGISKVTGFGVHASAALTMALTGDITVEQGSSTITFKSGDSLTVRGINNTLKLNGAVAFNGALTLAANARLTVEFDDVEVDPYVTFTPGSVSLGAGAELLFKGKGSVVLANNMQIAMAQSSQLTIADSALLTVAANGTATISGKGTVVLSDGGRLQLASPATLLLGNHYLDRVHLSCRRGGGAYISAPDATSGYARLSLSLGNHRVQITDAGFFHIGSRGIAEFGLKNSEAQTGGFEQFYITSNGFFLVESDGIAKFVDNMAVECDFDSRGGWIRGTGLIALYDRVNREIYRGKMYADKESIYTRNTAMGLRTLTKLLMQTDDALSYVTRFVNPAGNQAVITGRDIVVVLRSTESFVDEHTDGGFHTFDSDLLRERRYSPYGVES